MDKIVSTIQDFIVTPTMVFHVHKTWVSQIHKDITVGQMMKLFVVKKIYHYVQN